MKLSSHAQNTLAAVSFRCCNLGLENSYEETFCSWMWNFSSALWKYLLKGRNWSLMVNSLSQTMQAHTSQSFYLPMLLLGKNTTVNATSPRGSWLQYSSEIYEFVSELPMYECCWLFFLHLLMSQKVQWSFNTGAASTIFCYVSQLFILDAKSKFLVLPSLM